MAAASADVFGILHVQIVDVVDLAGSLATASALRVCARFGSGERSTARVAVSQGGAYFGRECLRFEVPRGPGAWPRTLEVRCVDARGGASARGAVDVRGALVGRVAHVDATAKLASAAHGSCALRVSAAFDVVEGPLRPGDAVELSHHAGGLVVHLQPVRCQSGANHMPVTCQSHAGGLVVHLQPLLCAQACSHSSTLEYVPKRASALRHSTPRRNRTNSLVVFRRSMRDVGASALVSAPAIAQHALRHVAGNVTAAIKAGCTRYCNSLDCP